MKLPSSNISDKQNFLIELFPINKYFKMLRLSLKRYSFILFLQFSFLISDLILNCIEFFFREDENTATFLFFLQDSILLLSLGNLTLQYIYTIINFSFIIIFSFIDIFMLLNISLSNRSHFQVTAKFSFTRFIFTKLHLYYNSFAYNFAIS